MNDLEALFDFSFSVDDWVAIVQRFIDIVNNFFTKLGIKLFEDATTAAPAEDTTVA